jgi:hypothetical protein
MCASAFAAALASNVFAQSTVTVDATKPIRVVDDRMFGVNTAVWDGVFSDSQTLATLQGMDAKFLRYPGGSSADDYIWTNNKSTEGASAGSTDFDQFAAQALAIKAQVVITTNYGTGTPALAASWVQYSNIQQGYGFKYWEIGNECYGTWEDDTQAVAHDPYTYAMQAVQYMNAMRAVDPTIKIGVVAVPGEDAFANNTNHPATNPVTKAVHNGWTPVMLATLAAQGVYPDFIIYHNYEQNAGQENDSLLLQSEVAATPGNNTWRGAATDIRGQLTDYLGSSGSKIELVVTENNSVSTNPGKQSTSLVNGLYYADSVANLMQTEINGMVWWDLHNGASTAGNNSSSLYGWRGYGDYGVENGGANSADPVSHDKYPSYYIYELLTHFARGGDTVLTASSNNPLLSAYATKRADGTMSLLVINKSPTASITANFSVAGFTPHGNATVYSYGIPQDEYSEENAVAAAAPTLSYSFENSMDGWVNQSGQPDTTATNFGLDGPFLYTLGYSTTTGVTSGTYSLSATTTAANPMDNAVIQNSTASIGLALSTAASVTLDVLPQMTGAGTVQVSLYINGTNIPYVLVGAAQTLNVNQENTVTFPLTDAMRAGIVASLVSGDYFQTGININAPAPLTVYFDNFVITPQASSTSAPTPTPIPGAASSPDLAVSTQTGVGPTFTASFGPYSATVMSLMGPTSAPVSSSQPASVNVASGHTASFGFPATGGPAPTFQWYLNGAAIAGATSSTLIVSGASASDQGNYTCIATNASGSLTSSAAALTVTSTADPGRLINLSCRAEVGTGANILFGGFAIGGAGTSGQQSVLVRASGPALTAFGVPGTLPDPQLQMFDGTGAAISGDLNNGWAGATAIANTAAAVHAFAWTSTTSHDAALDLSLASGPYTAQVSGQSGDTGDALAEVYDATPSGTYTASTPRLINLSARVNVGTGSNSLIAGFVIGGTTSVTVLIRASGPALTQFGISGVLPDPILVLQNQAGTAIATNSSWGGDSVIASVGHNAGAFNWPDAGSHDSALLVTLPPGQYTANVSGVSNDTGVGLVEVYEIQ